MRISRPCYDKYHRCPGWAGGGTKYAKITRCHGGSLTGCYERRLWKWRRNKCPACGVTVLPYMVRWLDLGWWKWQVGWARYRWYDWREERRRS